MKVLQCYSSSGTILSHVTGVGFLVLLEWKGISITLNFVKIVAGIREDISLNSLSWWLIHKQMCLVMFFFVQGWIEHLKNIKHS